MEKAKDSKEVHLLRFANGNRYATGMQLRQEAIDTGLADHEALDALQDCFGCMSAVYGTYIHAVMTTFIFDGAVVAYPKCH